MVFIAALAALLAAPRSTAPDILPLPLPNRRSLARAASMDSELSRDAREKTLPFEVRAVGELLRRVAAKGERRDSRRSPSPAPRVSSNLLDELRSNTERALALHGTRPLLALRAVQTELFVTATHGWERDRVESQDLGELGGDFLETARANGWLAEERLLLDDEERAVLFRARFGELTGLGKRPPFRATLDERRVGYSLVLRHPAGKDARGRLESQLAAVAALSRLDPDYPAAFARGVLLCRAQAFDAAADAFRAHLAARPDGAWTLRAKNHLLFALAQLPSEG